MTYEKFRGFAHVLLEESYVLNVIAQPGCLHVSIDLALLPGHAAYSEPTADERFCYRRATIQFAGVAELSWTNQGRVPAIDATGERDFGSVDAFDAVEGGWLFTGDWGDIQLKASAVDLVIDEAS